MGETKYSVVIVGAEQEEETMIRQKISDLVNILAVEQNPRNTQTVVGEKSPNIVLFYLDHSPEEILAASKDLSLGTDCFSIVISKNRDPNNILLAMRSGARDFAFLDRESAADIRRAITDLGTLKEKIEAGSKGKIITLFSSKGGSGATTIAANLAGDLLSFGKTKSEERRKVALLDFDLAMGDVLVFLDLEVEYSFVELLNNLHRLDSELLYQSLASHSSGVHVVSQTDKVEEAQDLTGEDMSKILAFLRQHFDYIVIDGIRDFQEMSLVGLDNADYVVMTITPDIPALKNANRCLRLFSRLGYPKEKIKLVLNRYRKTRNLNTDSISDALGRTITATIANDFPVVIESINQGRPLVQTHPNSKVAKDIKNLVAILVDGAPMRKMSLLPWVR